MTVIDSASRFQRAAAPTGGMTPFERDVAIAFETHKGNPAHSHLFVTLDYDQNGPYNAGKNGARIPASLDIFPIDPDEDPIHCMEIARAFFGSPRETIMILDLHGGPLAQQIPDWKPGTIHTTEQFMANPVLSLGQNKTPPRTGSPPALSLIPGGIS
jgi:hypothetical protein